MTDQLDRVNREPLSSTDGLGEAVGLLVQGLFALAAILFALWILL